MDQFEGMCIFVLFGFLSPVLCSLCNNRAQNVTKASLISAYQFDSFDNPVVTDDKLNNYLDGCQFWKMPNLSTEERCEKGCTAHDLCRAYRFDENIGCDLCVTEIASSTILIHSLTRQFSPNF